MKFLVSGVHLDVLNKSDKYPSAVCCLLQWCRQQLECAAMQAVGTQLVQRHYWSTGSQPKLCLAQVHGQGSAHQRQTTDWHGCLRHHMLVMEAIFCYLGDMLCSGGGCDSAIATRCCMARGKFIRLVTTRHLTSEVRGKVFTTCVCSVML